MKHQSRSNATAALTAHARLCGVLPHQKPWGVTDARARFEIANGEILMAVGAELLERQAPAIALYMHMAYVYAQL